MLRCDVQGCREWASESITPDLAARFAVIKQSEWPNLDWWALGGVDRIVLCPRHKIEVAAEICKQRANDCTMDQTNPAPDNHS
jgi:hypothetical protein